MECELQQFEYFVVVFSSILLILTSNWHGNMCNKCGVHYRRCMCHERCQFERNDRINCSNGNLKPKKQKQNQRQVVLHRVDVQLLP